LVERPSWTGRSYSMAYLSNFYESTELTCTGSVRSH
jgi:hypothetical protein